MSSIKEFQHLKISLLVLRSATDNFSKANCIGRGGFGKVYKGEILLSGVLTMVAIKRLDTSLGQGTVEFWKEIMMLSQYKHINLVSLLGFCDEGGESLLVYEYLSNKSLDIYLKSHPDLSWHNRLHICYGAATGLKFLHEPVGGSQQRVLHRDIKSANILLDNNLQSKIADFGLSKLGPANQQFSFMFSNAVGTPGYCDPLYAHTGLLTKESDVYSFGVVLFEVLCGRPAYVHDYNDIRRSLTGLARKCYEEKKLDTILQGGIRDTISTKSLERFSTIAYQCLNIDRAERPSMAKILEEINVAYLYQIISQNRIQEVEWKQIKVATNNFKLNIGEKEHSYQLYEGELFIFGKPTRVFIKRFLEDSEHTLTSYLRLVKTLSTLHHPNYISTLCYGNDEKEKFIVFEYPMRGSLDQYIKRSNTTYTPLTWLQRLQICVGAGQGLSYLHSKNMNESGFKSAFIVLDDKWVAKIADLEISTSVVPNHVYSAPEYIINGLETKSNNVYAFGIVLFEVLCGRLCSEIVDGCKLSSKLIKELYENKKLDEMVDPVLREEKIISYYVDKYSAIAYQCLLDDPQKRPSINDVVTELEELLSMEVELNTRFEKQGKNMQAKMELIEEELAQERALRKELEERMKSLMK